MTTPDDTPTPDPIRALDQLIGPYAPRLRGRAPLWYWSPPAIDSRVLMPEFSWRSRAARKYPAHELVTLDCNGAYLSPLSGTDLALSGLVHSGPQANRRADGKVPGYYLVDAQGWQDVRLPSPLGTGQLRRQEWITAPTLELLRQLERAQLWPEITIHDAWTAKPSEASAAPWAPRSATDGKPEIIRLRDWAAWLREGRLVAIAQGPDARKAFRDGYGSAFGTLKGDAEGKARKSKVRRPDWYRHLVTAHAANMWRKAWRATEAGAPCFAMDAVDTLTFHHTGIDLLLQLEQDLPKSPPIRFDFDGLALGAFKIKMPKEGDE